MVLFGFITAGIYDLYWFYKTRKELVAHGSQIPPIIILFIPFFIFLSIALSQFAVHFALANTTPDNSLNCSVPNDFNAEDSACPLSDSRLNGSDVVTRVLNIISVLFGVLAVIAGIPLVLWWYYKYCKAAEHVTQGGVTFGMGFGIGIILYIFGLSFITPGLFQDAYNRVGLGTPGADSAPVSAA